MGATGTLVLRLSCHRAAVSLLLLLCCPGFVSAPQAGTGTPDPRCRNASTASDILSTGSVNLLRFGAHADSATDDSDILRAAISCHTLVFIPSATLWPPKAQPSYLINDTIVLADSDPCPQCASVGQTVLLHGVGQGATPASVLRTHSPYPLVQIGNFNWKYSDGATVTLRDLSIEAVRVGVLVVATSDVHLTRVTIKVRRLPEFSI